MLFILQERGQGLRRGLIRHLRPMVGLGRHLWLVVGLGRHPRLIVGLGRHPMLVVGLGRHPGMVVGLLWEPGRTLSLNRVAAVTLVALLRRDSWGAQHSRHLMLRDWGIQGCQGRRLGCGWHRLRLFLFILEDELLPHVDGPPHVPQVLHRPDLSEIMGKCFMSLLVNESTDTQYGL